MPAFYKLRLRQEGRLGLENPVGWSGSHVQFAFLLPSFNWRHSLLKLLLLSGPDYIWKLGSSHGAKLAHPSKLPQRGKGYNTATFCFPCCCCSLSSGEGSRMVGGIDIPVAKITRRQMSLSFSFPYLITYAFFQLRILRLT